MSWLDFTADHTPIAYRLLKDSEEFDTSRPVYDYLTAWQALGDSLLLWESQGICFLERPAKRDKAFWEAVQRFHLPVFDKIHGAILGLGMTDGRAEPVCVVYDIQRAFDAFAAAYQDSLDARNRGRAREIRDRELWADFQGTFFADLGRSSPWFVRRNIALAGAF